jgi:hypothetical protein
VRGGIVAGEKPVAVENLTPKSGGIAERVGAVGAAGWFLVPLFFAVLFVIGLAVHGDYGAYWDESLAVQLGTDALDFAFEGDTSLLSSFDRYHGQIVEMVLVAAGRLLGRQDIRDQYLLRHLLLYLLFLAAVFSFYRICRVRFGSWRIGLLGSSFLVLSPRIFAESFYNSKDLAFLSVFIIGMHTLMRVMERITAGRVLAHAVMSALAIGIRMPGVMVPFLTVVLAAAGIATSGVKREDVRPAVTRLAAYAAATCLLTILFWPVLWAGPLDQFLAALAKMSHYPITVVNLFFGKKVMAGDLPWYYIPGWMAVSTPLLYLVLFPVGVFFQARRWVEKGAGFLADLHDRYDLLFMLWFFLPLVSVILLHSVLYAGWRHLYFIYPAFLLIGLSGLVNLRAMTGRWTARLGRAGVGLVVIVPVVASLATTAQWMIRNHPYQFAYFNSLAGRDVRRFFDVDYWGVSYKQGLEYILSTDRDERIPVAFSLHHVPEVHLAMLSRQERERLAVVDMDETVSGSEPPGRSEGSGPGPKYFLTNYRFHPDDYPLDEVYSVVIDGGKIMTVFKLR